MSEGRTEGPGPGKQGLHQGRDVVEDVPRHLRGADSSFERYRVRKVLGVYRPGKEERVLVLGCGRGAYAFAVAPVVREVVGIDPDEGSVELCRERARAERVQNARFLRADLGDIELETESFDLIVAADIVERLTPERTEDALDECRRLLKRGGRLVVWTPNASHFLQVIRDRTPFLRPASAEVDYMSLERIRRLLLNREFSIEKAFYTESHVPVLRELERSFMSFFPLLRRRIAVLGRKR